MRVAELVGQGVEVDAEEDGHTALWTAVWHGHRDVARALAAAGADPWKPMMGGWSPGRLSLAGPEPELFERPAGAEGLTEEEAAAVVEAGRLSAALGEIEYDGFSIACVGGIDAAEVVRRLEATVEAVDPEEIDPFDDENELLVGVTGVPGGCVVSQQWGYLASTPRVSRLLSAGTVCYALYANPKSGNQGSAVRDGEIVGWDLHPGGFPVEDEDVLLSYLYRYDAPAYACAYAGVRPADERAVVGPPDVWLRLPDRDYWS